MGIHTLSPKNIDYQAICEKHLQECREKGWQVIETYQEPEEKGPSFMPPTMPMRYYECTFDSFSGNEKLVEDLKKHAAAQSDIILTGQTGCGKTHLACAILHEIKTLDGALFITVPELLVKARSSFRDDSPITEDDLINQYTKCQLLCLDDLGAEKTTEYSIQVLYLIINKRQSECLQTIITTNLSLPEIEKCFGARIASRLSEMVNIKINMPDYRKKRP